MNEVESTAKEYVDKILEHIGVAAEVKISTGVKLEDGSDSYNVELFGNDLGAVIGYHGEGLSALQSILPLMVSKKLGKYHQLYVDINEYRKEREEKIKGIIRNAIDKVRFNLTPVELSPMTPAERRLVHMEVSQYADVASESTGEGYSRRVVIKPKS